MTQSEQQRETPLTPLNQISLRNHRTIQKDRIFCHWSPRRDDKQEGGKNIPKDVIAENVSNLPRIPNKINPKKSMVRDIIIKLLKTKVKEKYFDRTKEK